MLWFLLEPVFAKPKPKISFALANWKNRNTKAIDVKSIFGAL